MVVSFRDTYFVAGNMAVAVVGDVKHEEMFTKLAQAFAEMRAGPVPSDERRAGPAAGPQAPGR